MNLTDAAELGDKISKSWRGGPAADIWTEVLEEMHTGQARETYRRLRDSEDRAPSVSTFKAMYRSLTLDEGDKVICRRCESSGFVKVTDGRQHWRGCPGEDCRCSATEPCTCELGRAVTAGYQRTVAASASINGKPLR